MREEQYIRNYIRFGGNIFSPFIYDSGLISFRLYRYVFFFIFLPYIVASFYVSLKI